MLIISKWLLVYYAIWLALFIYCVRFMKSKSTAWDDVLVAGFCALWPLFLPLWVYSSVHRLADALTMHERNWRE